MELDLVDRGTTVGLGFQPLQIVDAEVRDADRPGIPLVPNPLEGAPRVDEAVVRGNRPVDQVQVDVVHAEAPEALGTHTERRVESVARVPELRRDEDLVARDPRAGDRFSHALLVAVRRGGVY